MSFRQLGRLAVREVKIASSVSTRAMSSVGPLVDVKVNDKTGVATVTMQRAPVNGLNLELLAELGQTFDDLSSNRSKGMILTSVSYVFLFVDH